MGRRGVWICLGDCPTLRVWRYGNAVLFYGDDKIASVSVTAKVDGCGAVVDHAHKDVAVLAFLGKQFQFEIRFRRFWRRNRRVGNIGRERGRGGDANYSGWQK